LSVSKDDKLEEEFYAKAGEATALLQQKQQPVAPAIFDSPYKGMQSENGGVVGMLEVIESDFARLEADTKAAEASAQKEYDTFMTDSKDDKEGHEYRHFLACVFWLNPKDDSDDAEGCSSMMFMKKYTVRKWSSVPNPQFEVISPGSEWGVIANDQKITNGQIRKAIERDKDIFNLAKALEDRDDD